MLELKNKSMCSGCGACKNICPKNAIIMVEDEEGFIYPVIDIKSCIKCGVCEKICPTINQKEKVQNLPKAYAAYNKNEDIRMHSSSGGIFTEIAKEILKNNGVVFGAVFDEDFNVMHDEITTEHDLEKIRGSKYVQSEIRDTYISAKNYLEKGKSVLFTGTPCQIEGLYNFLRKDYDNLYTQDLICHGVPSKKVWEKYLAYRKEKDYDIPKKLTFRNKANKGWSHYQVSFQYLDKEVNINHNRDLYMKMFLSDIALRPSCYHCQFKQKYRKSDITLADFWGINNVIPSMNDEKGTSLLIVNSTKGSELLKKIKHKIEYKEVDFESSIKENKSMIESANIKNRKKELFTDLEILSFEEIVQKYLGN